MTFNESLEKFKRLRESIDFIQFGHDYPCEGLLTWSDDPQWKEFVEKFIVINNQVVKFNQEYNLGKTDYYTD